MSGSKTTKIIVAFFAVLALVSSTSYYLERSGTHTDQELPRPLYKAPEIQLTKLSELYNPEILHAAQGIRAYPASQDRPDGELAVASGYHNGADLYSLQFEPYFAHPFTNQTGEKTLFGDVVKRQDGSYAYTDFKGHRIIVLDKDGQHIHTWDEDLALQYPIGIDEFSNGDLLIVDYGNDALKLTNKDGKLLRTVKKIGDVSLDTPYDARIKDDIIYLVDRTHHRLFVLDKAFQLLHTIEKTEQGEYYFYHPQHIDFDSKGRLYVMDTKSQSVKIVDIEKRHVIAQLTHPDIASMRGLAIDNQDNIYLAGFKTNHPPANEIIKESHAGIIKFQSVADQF